MRDDDAGGMTLYTKTGTHLADDGSGNAWWVGWVEDPRGNASFALGATPKTADDRAKRIAPGKAAGGCRAAAEAVNRCFW